MNQEIIKSAFEKTLTSLDSFCKWFLSFSIIVWWAAISGKNETISFLNLDVDRKEAFALIGVVFIVLNIALLLKIKRLHNLIRATKDEGREQLFTHLLTHDWILNPFALSNIGGPNAKLPSIHPALLVIVWWLCNMSLFGFFDSFETREGIWQYIAYLMIFTPFLLVGIMALKEIIEISNTAYHYTRISTNTLLNDQLQAMYQQMRPALLLGIFIGLACCLIFIRTKI